jgi:hypothetical protein
MEGGSCTFICTHEEWKVYELKLKLIEAGCDEKLIDTYTMAVIESLRYDS